VKSKAQVEYNEALKAKEHAKEEYEQKIRDIYHNGKYTDAYTRVLNTEVSNIRAAEAKLLELIYSREVQPKHIERDGVKVSVWRGDHETEYLKHDFFRAKPHAVFTEKDQIIKTSNSDLVHWLKPHLGAKGQNYAGPEVLVMLEGTALFNKDGDYKWKVCSDGNVDVYLGDLDLVADAHKSIEPEDHRWILHGTEQGKHSNWCKDITFPMRKGQEHSYTVTYWDHVGKAGLSFQIIGPDGPLKMQHIDRSVLHM